MYTTAVHPGVANPVRIEPLRETPPAKEPEPVKEPVKVPEKEPVPA